MGGGATQGSELNNGGKGGKGTSVRGGTFNYPGGWEVRKGCWKEKCVCWGGCCHSVKKGKYGGKRGAGE